MDSAFYYAHWNLGQGLEFKGLIDEAVSEYEKAHQLDDDPFVLSLLGHAYALKGRRADALKILSLKRRESEQLRLRTEAAECLQGGSCLRCRGVAADADRESDFSVFRNSQLGGAGGRSASDPRFSCSVGPGVGLRTDAGRH